MRVQSLERVVGSAVTGSDLDRVCVRHECIECL